MSLSANGRVGIAFVLGLGIGVAGVIGAQKVSEINLGDPMAGVTIVDKSRPIVLTPTNNIKRLEASTGADWSLTLRQDRGTYFGGKPLKSDQAFIRKLAGEVTVPPPAESRLTGVMTNALDEESKRANGTLYVMWFHQSPDTMRWLMNDEPVFTDARAEGERETYLAGPLVVYYAKPAGGRDWTPQIEQWVAEVVQCPMDANPCTVIDPG